MINIIRCPTCGTTWEVPQEASKTSQFRCSACQSVFSFEQTHGVELSESDYVKLSALERPEATRLRASTLVTPQPSGPTLSLRSEGDATTPPVKIGEARQEPSLGIESSPAEPAKTPEAKGEALMKTLQADVQSFESERAPEEAPQSGAHPFWRFLFVLALLALALLALLVLNQKVIEAAPALEPVYAKVCRQVPCPGFVWQDNAVFDAVATLNDVGAKAQPEGQNTVYEPTIVVTLTNTSDRPQRLPILSVRFKDASGETIAERVIEPSDYGYAQKNVVKPKGVTLVDIHVLTPLPYEPHSVEVAPVVNQ